MRLNSSWRATARKWSPHVGELTLVVSVYFVYMYTRKLIISDFEAVALANARKVIDLEKSLGFFWEPRWQSWALDTAEALVIFFNWAYILTFFPMVVATGVILYLANRRRYLYFRNVVLVSYVFALLIFMLFPLAPPRMLAGYFVDTIKVFGPAFYASREFANYYNAYAAMPSVHFSWTAILGVLFLGCQSKWLKALGIVYPTMTLFAITITGNHYIMDAVVGGLVMIAGFATMELGVRRRWFLPRLWLRRGSQLDARRSDPPKSDRARRAWAKGARLTTRVVNVNEPRLAAAAPLNQHCKSSGLPVQDESRQ